jgi:hypothetical protein
MAPYDTFHSNNVQRTTLKDKIFYEVQTTQCDEATAGSSKNCMRGASSTGINSEINVNQYANLLYSAC